MPRFRHRIGEAGAHHRDARGHRCGSQRPCCPSNHRGPELVRGTAAAGADELSDSPPHKRRTPGLLLPCRAAFTDPARGAPRADRNSDTSTLARVRGVIGWGTKHSVRLNAQPLSRERLRYTSMYRPPAARRLQRHVSQPLRHQGFRRLLFREYDLAIWARCVARSLG